MKFALPLLVLLAVASPLYAYRLPTTGNGALAKEMQDILDLVPLDKVILVIKTYWAQDKDVQAAIKLMKGEHIKQWLREIEANQAFRNLINWVQANGLDIYELINRYHKALGLAPLEPSPAPMSQFIFGGLNGFLADIRSLIPESKVLQLVNDKMVHSKIFRELILRVVSPETVGWFESVLKNPHFVTVELEMQKGGIDKNTWETTFPFFMLASVVVK